MNRAIKNHNIFAGLPSGGAPSIYSQTLRVTFQSATWASPFFASSFTALWWLTTSGNHGYLVEVGWGVVRSEARKELAYPIIEIEGIGEAFGKKLNDAGVRSTDHLLNECKTPRGRRQMAAKTEIPEALLLKWTNHADLFRIKGVAKQYAELLEAAGVDSVKELKHRRSDALSQALREINSQKHLCKISPSIAIVKKWIDQAKTLPAKITY